MFNSTFNFTDTRSSLLAHESGFPPGEFSVHQLKSIFHEVYNTFNENPSLELTDTLLNISKGLDRVWQKALLCKIKCMGIDGNFSILVESFLSDLTLMK